MALAIEAGGKPTLNQGENEPPSTLRRSGRARKTRGAEQEDPTFVPKKAQPQKTPSPVQSEESEPVRRNPKRKATPVSEEIYDVDVIDDLLGASLAAWGENELEEWPSWTEVESDPDLFNRILRLIGVKQARLQELYAVDQATLSSLPHPVYGLVFLYQYCGSVEDTNPVEPSPDLWFANQTTSNACATVAMLNIIMNAEGLELGDKLQSFKQESQNLSPPLRGHLLSRSTWLRVAANTFARRLDLLNSALALSNQVEESKAKERRLKQRPVKKRKIIVSSSTRRKKAGTSGGDDAAYHFVAYVPLHQKVWQLDGLEANPRCVGEFQEGEHWTKCLSEVLTKRMMESEEQALSFNLLALHGNVDLETEEEANAILGQTPITGRKKDHTPAIHEWVKKLAEHGVLGQLAAKVQLDAVLARQASG